MNWKDALRGKVVKTVVHPKTKREGVIRLSLGRANGISHFFAREIDSDRTQSPFVASTSNEVYMWLMEQLAMTGDTDKLDWLPVIEVSLDDKEDGSYRRGDWGRKKENLGVEVCRYYIALQRDETKWVRLSWDKCDPEKSGCLADKDKFSASEEWKEGPQEPASKPTSPCKGLLGAPRHGVQTALPRSQYLHRRVHPGTLVRGPDDTPAGRGKPQGPRGSDRHQSRLCNGPADR